MEKKENNFLLQRILLTSVLFSKHLTNKQLTFYRRCTFIIIMILLQIVDIYYIVSSLTSYIYSFFLYIIIHSWVCLKIALGYIFKKYGRKFSTIHVEYLNRNHIIHDKLSTLSFQHFRLFYFIYFSVLKWYEVCCICLFDFNFHLFK